MNKSPIFLILAYALLSAPSQASQQQTISYVDLEKWFFSHERALDWDLPFPMNIPGIACMRHTDLMDCTVSDPPKPFTIRDIKRKRR